MDLNELSEKSTNFAFVFVRVQERVGDLVRKRWNRPETEGFSEISKDFKKKCLKFENFGAAQIHEDPPESASK